MTRLIIAIRRLFCAHLLLKHCEGSRVVLRCDYCGFETEGWTVSGAPRQRYTGDAKRLRIAKPVIRRVA